MTADNETLHAAKDSGLSVADYIAKELAKAGFAVDSIDAKRVWEGLKEAFTSEESEGDEE